MTKKQTKLGIMDGKTILATSIKITNAGDGLSKALATDPQLIHLDEKVYVVLETECSNISFQPIKDVDGVARVHTLRAGLATIVDRELVADMLEAQRVKNDEAEGKYQLPYGSDERTDEEIIGGED